MHQVIRKENVGSASNLAMTSQAPPPPPSLTFSLHVIAESISVQRIWCSRRQTDRQTDRQRERVREEKRDCRINMEEVKYFLQDRF